MVDPLAAGWLTTDEAEALTGYSVAYLRRLATQGRITARKIGRDWVIYRESLLAYKERMDVTRHLFLDHDAIPTLVKVERSSDTRVRREVVGQMLDYAATGAALDALLPSILDRAFKGEL